MPKTYIMRDLTDEQERIVLSAQARAKAEGRGLKWVILHLLALYGRRQVDVDAAPARGSESAPTRARDK